VGVPLNTISELSSGPAYVLVTPATLVLTSVSKFLNPLPSRVLEQN
jgi:hypothetical protein